MVRGEVYAGFWRRKHIMIVTIMNAICSIRKDISVFVTRRSNGGVGYSGSCFDRV